MERLTLSSNRKHLRTMRSQAFEMRYAIGSGIFFLAILFESVARARLIFID